MEDRPESGQIPETNDQKRARAIERLGRADAAGLSDRAIAAELGVSQPFISALRKTLRSADNGEPADDPLVAGEGDAAQNAAREQHRRLISDAAQSATQVPVPATGENHERPQRPSPGDPLGRTLSEIEEAAARHEPDARNVLAQLADEGAVVSGRLEHLQAEHQRVADRVIRGTATHDELHTITRGIEELRRKLETFEVLRARAQQLAGEQEAREHARQYHEALDRYARTSAAVLEGPVRALDQALDTIPKLVSEIADGLDPVMLRLRNRAVAEQLGNPFTRRTIAHAIAVRLWMAGLLREKPGEPLESVEWFVRDGTRTVLETARQFAPTADVATTAEEPVEHGRAPAFLDQWETAVRESWRDGESPSYDVQERPLTEHNDPEQEGE